MKTRKIPMRMCVACRTMKPKKELLRIVRDKSNAVTVDINGKASGRGAYICSTKDCLDKAIKTNAINRALETKLDEDTIKHIDHLITNAD